MKKRDGLTRRLFFQLLAGFGTGLFGWSWYKLSQVQTGKQYQSKFSHDADIPMGVSYFGRYYLVRNEKGVRAFSTTCTHAGCRLGKEQQGYLSCGCHGSRFEAATGIPVKGPAYRPLKELECYFEQDLGKWIIKMETVSS